MRDIDMDRFLEAIEKGDLRATKLYLNKASNNNDLYFYPVRFLFKLVQFIS